MSIFVKTVRAVQHLALSGPNAQREKLNAPQVNACRTMQLVLIARMDVPSINLSNVSGLLSASPTT